jgi:curli biogenesis system outer membrane secretion channel CsgG
MSKLSGAVFRLMVLLIVFLLFSGNELYAKKISRSSSPGSSSYSYDNDDDNGFDDDTGDGFDNDDIDGSEGEPAYQEQKPKKKGFFKRKTRGKRSSEDMEEDDGREMAEGEWKDEVRQAKHDGSVYFPKTWPPYEGEKVSIAVIDFEDGISKTPIAQGLMDKDAFLHVFYGFGEGLASMLVSTLQDTSRFNILEKKISKRVFDIYSTNAANSICQSGRSKISQTPGVRYFVLGSVTDITEETNSGGGQVKTSMFSVAAGQSIASITLHLRVIDTSTGLVVYSKRLEGTLVGKSLNLGVNYAGIGAGGSKSVRTQLGNAAQKVLDKCAEDIIAITS